ncbi:hypothetical protein MMC29_000916 [Sticta canariensis]|nr:hypothetical protein [Sticta canariensis]
MKSYSFTLQRSTCTIPPADVLRFRCRQSAPRVERAICRATQEQSCRVYVAALPLVGTEAVEGALKALGRSLPAPLALHRVVLIQKPDQQATLALLAGASVEGVVRERHLSKLPSHNWDFVGYVKADQASTLAFARRATATARLGINRMDPERWLYGAALQAVILARYCHASGSLHTGMWLMLCPLARTGAPEDSSFQQHMGLAPFAFEE